MQPRSIVFLGASNSIMTIGTSHMLNLVRGGYKGKIYPVHPTEDTVLGIKAYKRIMDLPEPVDLAVMVIPKHLIPQALEECGKKGIRRAVIITSGFREIGSEEGERLQDLIDDVAKRYGIRYLGPNCMGVINTHLFFNITWFPYKDKPGSIGLISQSGSYVTQTLSYLRANGIRISQAISVGNQANIDIVDCLDYLGDDPYTKVIAIYMEDIKRPREFLNVCRHIVSKKPVVAMFVGDTEEGARACRSHTAAISGRGEIYRGFFKQAGIIMADTFYRLFDFCLALSEQPLPKGRNMAILTNSGGPATTMANECGRLNLVVPVFDSKTQQKIKELLPPTGISLNPVDLTLNYDVELLYIKLPHIILNLPYIDGLLFYGIFGPIHIREKMEMGGDLVDIPMKPIETLIKKSCQVFTKIPTEFNKPIICASFFGREDEAVRIIQDGGIPVYSSPERAVRAMLSLCEYREIRERFVEKMT